MRRIWLSACAALCLSAGSALAQSRPPAAEPAEGPPWMGWVGAAALLAHSFTLDHAMRSDGTPSSGGALGRWAYGVSNLHELWPVAVGATAVGTLFDPGAPRVALEMGAGVLSAAAAAELVKRAAGRERPRHTDDPFHFELAGDGRSFPSGHAVAAFAIAGAVAAETRHPWIRGGAFTLAALVAGGRVAARAHWASDVVAGALLGAAVGYRTTSALRGRRPGAPDPLPVTAFALEDGVGVGLRLPFSLTSAF